jgi:hypothetical protein
MGCVHTHKRRLIIEGCGNPNHIETDVKKTKENIQKVGKSIKL